MQDQAWNDLFYTTDLPSSTDPENLQSPGPSARYRYIDSTPQSVRRTSARRPLSDLKESPEGLIVVDDTVST